MEVNIVNINTIRDPIYGFIGFSDWEKNVIDHPCFQRLRRVCQLGLTSFIYPGATHSRFEHSLGVMHLATLMYEKITNDPKNFQLLLRMGYTEAGLEREKQLIRFAALLHDIGHPPFSHTSEELMPLDKKNNRKFTHEDYSVRMIRDMLKEVIENNPANVNYKIKADEVASFIEVNPKITSGAFWRVLISNQIDADRGDYLMRDSHHIGVTYGIYDYHRLLDTLALGEDPETGDIVIGINKGGLQVAEAFVLARYQMFSQVYFHKTRCAFDYHLQEALKITLRDSFPPPSNIKKYIEIDDYTIWEKIKSSEDKNCQATIQRCPIKEVFDTDDIPTTKEIKKFENITVILYHPEVLVSTFFNPSSTFSFLNLNV